VNLGKDLPAHFAAIPAPVDEPLSYGNQPVHNTIGDFEHRERYRTHCQLIETAAQLFAERGFEAVTVADVARAADVSEQTVYNYFSYLNATRPQLIGVKVIDCTSARWAIERCRRARFR
jgi:hypothetical protein